MKIFRKILSLIIVSILFLQNIETSAYDKPKLDNKKTIKAAVFLNNLNNLIFSDIKKSLEEIQKKSKNEIEFTFFDSKGNQVIQNQNIDEALGNLFDFFVVNPITTKPEEIQSTLNKIVHANMPLILYKPTTSSIVNIVKSAPKTIAITGDFEQAGTLQGKILANTWNTNKNALDRNKDNKMQYVLLRGPSNYSSAIGRTNYSIRALNDSDIKTHELLSTICNWDTECAKLTIESKFITIGSKMEAVISNNDEMAIGAIEALQKYGFNKGADSKYIPVVGIGGSEKAKELVDKGIMTGTVIEDLYTEAKAIHTIGMNLVLGIDGLEGTNLKFDKTGITVRIPYYEYINLTENK